MQYFQITKVNHLKNICALLLMSCICASMSGCMLDTSPQGSLDRMKVLQSKKYAMTNCNFVGDLNNDEKRNIFDAIILIESMTDGEPEATSCTDINQDGILNIVDLVGVFQMILNDAPFYEDACGNGSDDDYDWRVDCEDPDCALSESCYDPNGGGYLARHMPVPQGMHVFMRNGPGGLDTIEEVIEAELNNINLMSSIPNPISTGNFGCWDVTAKITDIDYDSISVGFEPQNDGTIRMETVLRGFEAGFKINFDRDGICIPAHWDKTGEIGFSKLILSAKTYPMVQSGNFSMGIDYNPVEMEGFFWNVNNFPGEIEQYYRDDIRDAIVNAIDNSFSGKPSATLIEIVNNAQMPAQSFIVDDNVYEVRTGFAWYSPGFGGSGISVDANGISFEFETHFKAQNWFKDSNPGSYMAQKHVPVFSESHGIGVSLGANQFNKALYALWGGGALDELDVDINNIGESFDVLDLLDDPELIAFLEGFDLNTEFSVSDVLEAFFACSVDNVDVETMTAPYVSTFPTEDAAGQSVAITLDLEEVEMRLQCGHENALVIDLSVQASFELGHNTSLSAPTYYSAIDITSYDLEVEYPNDLLGPLYEAIIDQFALPKIDAHINTIFANHPVPEFEGLANGDFSISTSDGHINFAHNIE